MNKPSQLFYLNLKKSKLTPPSYVFGIVWPFLYILLLYYFISLIIHSKCDGLCPVAIVFIVQMLLNFSWSPVFFRYQKVKIAFLINLSMVGLTAITMYLNTKINSSLNYLLLPYLLWISFAAYLNGYIVFQN